MIKGNSRWYSGMILAVVMVPQLAQAAEDKPDSAPKADATATDIVVTGSRVITNGNNSPTPLTAVTMAKLLETTPSNVPDALNKLPIFSNSLTSQTLGNSGGNNVGNFMNLRGFGIQRTLVMLDGHRLPATNSTGSVDTNILPELLLQRVDVVTGGASAVYGSDAVTGVVNYVLDKKFNGFKAEAQGGISQYGDAGSYRFGLAWGTKLFDGRGHFEASYEQYHQDGLTSKLDRPNGQAVYSEEGAGTAASPFHLVANTRNNNSSYGGLILSGPLAGMQFAGSGSALTAFNHGAATGSAGIESGGDGSYISNSALTAGITTHHALARFDYDLSDSTKAYVQVNWASSTNSNTFVNFALFPGLVSISATNPYLSPAIQAQLAGSGSFLYGRSYDDVPGIETRSVTDNLDITAGLTGKLGSAFNWDAFYTHGVTHQTVSSIGNINLGRLYAALDTVDVGGTIQCRANTGIYAGCIPLNPFTSGQDNAAAIAWARGTTAFDLTNTMDDMGGSVSGTPFNTWAGPVRFALSGEYRRVTLNNVSNAQPSSTIDCTGIAVGCNSAAPLWLSNTVANAYGAQNVAEGALEVNVPVLRDMPLAQSFEINGAVRFTHYSTSGNATTWKIGGDWHVNDVLSFRATRSRDIRAPNLSELFAPVNSSQTGFTDTHTNTAGVVTIVTQGNPNLVPEVAQTLTVGMVLKPTRRLSLSVDYYHIKIANAIAGVGGNDATTLQLCEASGGTSPLCALYVRPYPFSNTTSANYPTYIISEDLNVGQALTKGIDTELNWSHPVGNSGSIDLRALVSYQPVLSTTLLGTTINAAGAAGQQGVNGQAKWRATMFLSYHNPVWGADIEERWRSALKPSGDPDLVYSDPDVPSIAYTDLTLTFHPGSMPNRTVFFSVQNLFNQTAPVFISPAFASNPGFYYPAVNGDDVIGRYFTAGVRFKF
jgi:iron complex outermembrane recepter protein